MAEMQHIGTGMRHIKQQRQAGAAAAKENHFLRAAP